MTRSMTGYSSISGTHDLFNFLIQIRSENSKSLEISIIDDLNNFKLQEKIKKIIRKDFSRGKIRIVISCKPDQKFVKSKNIEKVLSDFTNLTKKRGLVPTISLLELREIINTESTKMQSNLKNEQYQIFLTKKAINQLIKNQKEEGYKLLKELNKKINNISKLIQKIDYQVGKFSKRITRRYEKEFSKIKTVEDFDIKREISILLEKVDIEEEIIKLESHISKLKSIIKTSEPKGLMIDFYMQEINREANTLASKSKDFSISKYSIEIKRDLNQIREIAANII
ncbi:MAG: DUF1732 domain-containing protein [Thermodesulfobacteriota bacterium]|nr:DUF1732 domain-containing protein [Thermodesulfobacteriota bacterium]